MAMALADDGTKPKQAQASPRVLVVDDDPQIRALMSEALRSAGLKVRMAQDGETALSLYHEHQARQQGFDLVLLDLSLPSMSGQECLSRLLELDQGAQVLITTGWAPEEGEELLGEGAQSPAGFLQKPFSLNSLLGRVHRLLDQTGEA
jgi:DNA-binding response OmpR family regulator